MASRVRTAGESLKASLCVLPSALSPSARLGFAALGNPCEKTPQACPFAPHQRKEFARVEFRSFLAKKSFQAPSNVRRCPGTQPVPFGGDPVIVQRVPHEWCQTKVVRAASEYHGGKRNRPVRDCPYNVRLPSMFLKTKRAKGDFGEAGPTQIRSVAGLPRWMRVVPWSFTVMVIVSSYSRP